MVKDNILKSPFFVSSTDTAKSDMPVVQTLRTSWNIKGSFLANHTINRIREIWQSMEFKPNPAKPMIPLSVGKLYLL